MNEKYNISSQLRNEKITKQFSGQWTFINEDELVARF